jgi:23S rRNA (uracil1939-C5)-methyltransferase
MCPIAAPLLWRAAAILMELATPGSALRRFLNAVSEVEFFCAADEFRLQILFFIRSPELARAESFAVLCEQIRQQLPQLTGAGATLDPELNRATRRNARRKSRWDDLAWGAAGLTYEAADRSYWVSRGAFFQVNRFLVDELVALVTGDHSGDQSGDLVWDLFAGVGLFTRALAERFTHVVAVEAGETAAADLAIAARGGKDRPPFEAVRATTFDFLGARELQRERPSLIVLDPPRAGLGPEAAEILTRIASPRVVYVSCDPVTLARDLAILTRVYRIDAIHLIDLFPQTFHMETVVHLSRIV